MQHRKIEVKIKASGLYNFLNSLKTNCINVNLEKSNAETLCITVSFIESKESFKILSTSSDILDWEFAESEGTDCKEIIYSNFEEGKKYLMSIKTPASYSTSQKPKSIDPVPDANVWNKIETFINLATIIEAVWKMRELNEVLEFNSAQFNTKLETEYDNLLLDKITIADRAVLNIILQSYYSDLDFSVVKPDVKTKLEIYWKKLNNYETLTKLIEEVFKK